MRIWLAIFSTVMQEPGPYVRAALSLTRGFARYFRYECEGFENLALAETALLVGYHGRPWTFDLILLCERMHRELGQTPQPIWARPMRWAPVLRGLVEEVGGLYSYPGPSQVQELKARGRHLVVLPGGLREGSARSGNRVLSIGGLGEATCGWHGSIGSRSCRWWRAVSIIRTWA